MPIEKLGTTTTPGTSPGPGPSSGDINLVINNSTSEVIYVFLRGEIDNLYKNNNSIKIIVIIIVFLQH